MSRCGACGRSIHKTPGPGRPRKCCANDRCRAIYCSGKGRTACLRCHGPLPRGRQYQRNAICGRCFVDLCDILGLAARAA